MAVRQAQLHGGHPAQKLGPAPRRVRQRTRQAADRDDERGERDAAELGGSARGGAGRGAADATRGVAGTRSGHRLHRPSTGADCNSIRRRALAHLTRGP